MSRACDPRRLAAFMIAYYATNCMYQSFLSLYYTAVAFSSAQIGIINACVALVSIAAQPVWGIAADRARDRAGLVALLAVLAAASMFAFRWSARFVPLMLLACVFAGFYTSIQPMGDAIILKALNDAGKPFGPIRMAGGLSFAVCGVLFGMLLNAPGRDRQIPLYIAGLCLIVAASTTALPRTSGGQSGGGRSMRFSALLEQRELVRLLCFMAPVQLTMGYFYTFFSPHFMTLSGANSALLGVGYFIAAVSEVPFLLNADRWFDRFGAGTLLCASAASLALRWVLVGLAGNVWCALATQMLHGGGFIVMTVCMAKYISRTVPEELQASGQMLLSIVTFGIARVAGNLGGGLLAGWLGRGRVFFICSAICLLTLLVGGRSVSRLGRGDRMG
ncbi:MAG: MFS transporter [Clostridia bacterium]|nr:MFS transporter [Clostridia bacterium]